MRLRRRGTPWTPRDRLSAAIAAFIGGLIMLGVNAYHLRDSFRLVRHGVHAVGRVERISTSRAGRHSRRHASVQIYGAHPGTCEIEGSGLIEGQNVDMLVLPDDPSVCSPATGHALWGLPGIGFAVGALLFLGSLVAYERARRGRPSP